MLVEEVRSQRQVGCTSVVSGASHGSLLAEISYGCPVWHALPLQVSIYAEAMLGSECCPEDKVLPVSLIPSVKLGYPVAGRSSCRVYVPVEVNQLRSRHHRHSLVYMLDAGRSVVGHLRRTTFSFLGSYEDDSVGSSGAVDRRGRSVLQDGE